MTNLKTRFAPSPTGHLHVGGARTALFNFLLARQKGGTFLFRVEDTDLGRNVEGSDRMIMEGLRWLGIEWDEGLDKGGPAGPYRQSERLDLYRQYAQKLLDSGAAYYAFETAEELDAVRKAAEARKETYRYRRPANFPTQADATAARAAGKPVVVRFAVPDGDVTVHDDAFGDVTVPHSEMDDFVILKGDGYPTYHLGVVIDDALMGVTYIMRGQEFLGQSWRHVLLRRALGFAEPGYCHLPLILDMQGRKLSKRDGDVDVHAFRRAGYLPEVLANFIALLGWRPEGDRERLTMDEMIASFSPAGVGKANAKFDRAKLLAFNTDAMAAAGEERLLAGFKDYLSLNETPIPTGDDNLLKMVLQINRGMRTYADVIARCGVLFAPDDSFAFDAKAVEKVLVKGSPNGYDVLAQLQALLAGVEEWTPGTIQKVLDDFCAANNLGLGKVAQPIRVAVTGTTISPAIGETLVLLGKDKTLARVDRCLATR